MILSNGTQNLAAMLAATKINKNILDTHYYIFSHFLLH